MIAAKNGARKRKFDRRGASISSDISGRGIRRWPTRPALSFHGLAPPVALDIHLEDCGVMEETIDRGERHCGIGKDLSPFAERLVGNDEHDLRS
jgi:hypothetical protein